MKICSNQSQQCNSPGSASAATGSQAISFSLEGEITVNDAAQLKEILLGYMNSEISVEIDLARITKIDTSGLQLLYAAHQTAIHQGKKLSLENPSPAFMESAKLAGLFFQSPEGYLEGCLWRGAPMAEGGGK